MTCWVWGMNGLGSVLGSVLATIISMNLGIQATFVAGIACYVIVTAIAFVLRAHSAESSATVAPECSTAVPERAGE